MKKLIAAINMTLDGYCDHTAVTPDEEMHRHYSDLLRSAGCILYGRVTYQLMGFWRDLVENPPGDKSMDDFAFVMDRVPKIVFSTTLKETDWKSARLADRPPEEEVAMLRNESGSDIFVGSPGLIVALSNLGLIDEYQIMVHPVIAGGGLPLFKGVQEKTTLRLFKTTALTGGAVIFYYEPLRESHE